MFLRVFGHASTIDALFIYRVGSRPDKTPQSITRHFQGGEHKPLEISIALFARNIEAELVEIENSEDEEPTTESAAAWLTSPLKDQNSLRKAARPECLHSIGLKCPGPEGVLDGLVLGTQVCPNSEIISLERGVLWRRNESSGQRIGLSCRCAPCKARYNFNNFLRSHVLEADAGQTMCSNKGCFKSVWEGTKFCHSHFLMWTPDLIGQDKTAMNELLSLFEKAISEQWRPKTEFMAEIIKRMESKGNIPASEVVNIDLAFGVRSREVLQIGLADLRGNGVLDCLTRYSEGIIAPSSSRLATPATRPLMNHERNVRRFSTQNGSLNAKEIVGKLQEIGISNEPIFLSLANWGFDLSYLRDWLEEEGFYDVLPGDENLCLLLQELRNNVRRVLGRSCFRGGRFPLSLSVVFLLLFGESHPLSGRNHHALVDAQQLVLIAQVFNDLCKPPPQNERVYWRRSLIKMPGSGERQRPLEEFFPSLSSNKKARLS
ncbi:hypothetical protein N7522_010286 [Penicillium canescens]|nr:hypothetical protein N7522_010286 [Penicillium canescens]